MVQSCNKKKMPDQKKNNLSDIILESIHLGLHLEGTYLFCTLSEAKVDCHMLPTS